MIGGVWHYKNTISNWSALKEVVTSRYFDKGRIAARRIGESEIYAFLNGEVNFDVNLKTKTLVPRVHSAGHSRRQKNTVAY